MTNKDKGIISCASVLFQKDVNIGERYGGNTTRGKIMLQVILDYMFDDCCDDIVVTAFIAAIVEANKRYESHNTRGAQPQAIV